MPTGHASILTVAKEICCGCEPARPYGFQALPLQSQHTRNPGKLILHRPQDRKVETPKGEGVCLRGSNLAESLLNQHDDGSLNELNHPAFLEVLTTELCLPLRVINLGGADRGLHPW